jgi:hypothetical protein
MRGCYDQLGGYDFINTFVCLNLERLDLEPTARAKLAAVCREAYCLYRPAGGDRVSMVREPECSRGMCGSLKADADAQEQPDAAWLFRRTLLLLLAAMAVVALLLGARLV